jgi:hypothetical protein
MVGPGRTVEVIPLGAALGTDQAWDRVDLDATHPAEIHDERVVRDRVPGDAVAATPNGDGEVKVARGDNGRDDVVDRPASNDHGRTTVVGRVEGRARIVVVAVTRDDDPVRDGGVEAVDHGRVQGRHLYCVRRQVEKLATCEEQVYTPIDARIPVRVSFGHHHTDTTRLVSPYRRR